MQYSELNPLIILEYENQLSLLIEFLNSAEYFAVFWFELWKSINILDAIYKCSYYSDLRHKNQLILLGAI